jgi:hypothetical protein
MGAADKRKVTEAGDASDLVYETEREQHLCNAGSG